MGRRKFVPLLATIAVIGALGVLGSILLAGDPMSPLNMKRTELYDRMASDTTSVLAGALTSQSLKVSDLFIKKNGKITPQLKPAEPSVRANVLHLSRRYAEEILNIVKDVLGPHLEDVWYQDPELYHFSLLHASHHLDPVEATALEIQLEIAAAKSVAVTCCPLRIQLERILLTSSGVLVSCWQVLEGTDPFVIRGRLKNSLPKSSKSQLYDPVILHSSLARIVPPVNGKVTSVLLERVILDLNKKLRNFQATVEELWFVEELDVLALALKGRMKTHKFEMQGNC